MKLFLQHTLLFFFSAFLFSNTCFATGGYEIKIKLTNFTKDTLLLGYHLGDKQYVRDTCTKSADGWFVFKGEDTLDCGVYLVIMPPDNQYFQIMIQNGETFFSLQTDAIDPYKDGKVLGSVENDLFFKYMAFLGVQRTEAETLKKEREGAAVRDSIRLTEKLNGIDQRVKDYQADIYKKYPASLTAAVIKSSLEPELPVFEGQGKEMELKKYLWYKEHFFDNIDLSDPCLLRTPTMFQKIDTYMQKLTVQHPDSINISVDYILNKVKSNEDAFQYYLVHFLNYYARSKFVGMDAVYVHIAKKYYAGGLAPWTEKETLDKILDNARRLEPILIGKIAPNIRMMTRDSTPVSLYDLKSDYTVLFIWAHDCGHCKTSMPEIIKFYEKFKNKGVKIYGVCKTKPGEEKKCWDFIDERPGMDWLNVIDPYSISRYIQLYDVQTTPQIFILDKNHKILSKRIGSEQLENVMDQIIEMNKKSTEGR